MAPRAARSRPRAQQAVQLAARLLLLHAHVRPLGGAGVAEQEAAESAGSYTDYWAVQVTSAGSSAASHETLLPPAPSVLSARADAVARDLGFVNRGPISPGALDYFHFQVTCAQDAPAPGGTASASKQCTDAQSHGSEHTGRLAGHPHVANAVQQVRRNRDQRRRRAFGAAARQAAAAADGVSTGAGQSPASAAARGRRSPFNETSDPLWYKQWHLHDKDGHDMNVRPAWDSGFTGKGVVVTVVDDGIQYDHPDLKDNYDPAASTDINGNDRDPYPNTADPINKHGTRCSGEIGAANNDVCGVGVAYNAKIGAVRMLDGDVTDAVEAQSLGLAPQHIDIYTNSWGPNDDGRTIEGPASLTRSTLLHGVTHGRGGKGSIYLFASGNGGGSDDCNADGYANSIHTIAVASVGNYETRKPYYVEPCAAALVSTPSSGDSKSITTTDLHKRCTSYHSGTSASSPLAAGAVALALEANPLLTWRDVQHVIVHTARFTASSAAGWVTNAAGLRHNMYFGFGVIDAGAMVRLAQNWTLVTAQRTTAISAKLAAPVAFARQGPGAGAKASEIAVGRGATGITKLEHVEVEVIIDGIGPSGRGGVAIDLVCPSGTPSPLLGVRYRDKSRAALRWTMTTVRCWGESPVGVFKLVVNAGSAGAGTLRSWSLTLRGTGEDHDLAPTTTATAAAATTTTTTAGRGGTHTDPARSASTVPTPAARGPSTTAAAWSGRPEDGSTRNVTNGGSGPTPTATTGASTRNDTHGTSAGLAPGATSAVAGSGHNATAEGRPVLPVIVAVTTAVRRVP